jgi:hypothetical protein
LSIESYLIVEAEYEFLVLQHADTEIEVLVFLGKENSLEMYTEKIEFSVYNIMLSCLSSVQHIVNNNTYMSIDLKPVSIDLADVAVHGYAVKSDGV